jgi:hypothetical protein
MTLPAGQAPPPAQEPAPPPPPPVPRRRRRRAARLRSHTLGLFKLTDGELADIRAAAASAGMTPGAYAAHTVTTTARHALILLPATDRERLAELLHARIELARIATLLPDAEAHTVLPELTRAARRIEQAADAIARHASRKTTST